MKYRSHARENKALDAFRLLQNYDHEIERGEHQRETGICTPLGRLPSINILYFLDTYTLSTRRWSQRVWSARRLFLLLLQLSDSVLAWVGRNGSTKILLNCLYYYNLSRIDLVILSAPYSDVLANTFLNLKIKTIIVINNKHRIDGDNLSRWFCCEFFQRILQGKTIQEAFDISLANIPEKRKTTCNLFCYYHSHKKC